MSLLLDAGALIAYERGSRTVQAFLERAYRQSDDVRTTTAVVAQSWHGVPGRRGWRACFEASTSATSRAPGRARSSPLFEEALLDTERSFRNDKIPEYRHQRASLLAMSSTTYASREALTAPWRAPQDRRRSCGDSGRRPAPSPAPRRR